jgi:ABC-type transport system involved in cytochrome c biogenesis permease component
MKKKRIKKIGVLQTSKVIAVYALIIALLTIIIGVILISLDNLDGGFGYETISQIIMLLIGLPILSFISTALSCLLYNLASKWTGGIEIYLEEKNDQDGGIEDK